MAAARALPVQLFYSTFLLTLPPHIHTHTTTTMKHSQVNLNSMSRSQLIDLLQSRLPADGQLEAGQSHQALAPQAQETTERTASGTTPQSTERS